MSGTYKASDVHEGGWRSLRHANDLCLRSASCFVADACKCGARSCKDASEGLNTHQRSGTRNEGDRWGHTRTSGIPRISPSALLSGSYGIERSYMNVGNSCACILITPVRTPSIYALYMRLQLVELNGSERNTLWVSVEVGQRATRGQHPSRLPVLPSALSHIPLGIEGGIKSSQIEVSM